MTLISCDSSKGLSIFICFVCLTAAHLKEPGYAAPVLDVTAWGHSPSRCLGVAPMHKCHDILESRIRCCDFGSLWIWPSDALFELVYYGSNSILTQHLT